MSWITQTNLNEMMLHLSDMRPLRYYIKIKHKKGKGGKGEKGKRDTSFDTLLLPGTLDVGERQAQLLQRYCCSQTCMKLNQLKLWVLEEVDIWLVQRVSPPEFIWPEATVAKKRNSDRSCIFWRALQNNLAVIHWPNDILQYPKEKITLTLKSADISVLKSPAIPHEDTPV